MKKVSIYLVVTLSIILIFTTSLSWANEKPMQKLVSKPKMMPNRNFIEVLWLWEITKVLNLNEEKLVAILPKLKDLNLLREETAKTKRELLSSLRYAIKRSQDDEINQILNKLKAVEENYILKKNAIKQEIRKELTLEEWAKFVLLQEEFSKKVRMILEDIRKVKSKIEKPPLSPKKRKR